MGSRLGIFRFTVITDFTGPNCEYERKCLSAPCQNGATCNDSADFMRYTCECPVNERGHTMFVGDNCETENPEPTACDVAPCLNGGDCVNSDDLQSYTCSCTTEYTGAVCETQIPC